MASTLREGGTAFKFIPYVPQSGPGATIQFRAHITNINTSFSPSWSEHMDMGRADPKFMYSQFSQTVNLDFVTIALGPGEHFKWLDALNSLATMTEPIYKPGKGFNGVYTRVAIGGYLDTVGMIQNLDFSVDNESPWKDDVPIYIQANMTLRVIKTEKPEFQKGLGTFGFGAYGVGSAV